MGNNTQLTLRTTTKLSKFLTTSSTDVENCNAGNPADSTSDEELGEIEILEKIEELEKIACF